GAGAVRAGGDRAVDGLPVDVAEVLHLESMAAQQCGHAMQPCAREQRDQARRGIRADEPLQVVEFEEHTRGDRDAGEAVPRADRLDRQSLLHCCLDRALDALGRTRALDPHRVHGCGSAPVAPGSARTRHRNAFPSPRYVGSSSTMTPSAISWYRSMRSAGSPLFACRNHTRSPTFSARAAWPCSGVCTSPAASRGKVCRFCGHTARGWRDVTAGPEAIQPPPSTVAMSAAGFRTTSKAKPVAGAGLNDRYPSNRCPPSSPLPAVASVSDSSLPVNSSEPVPPPLRNS